MDANERGCVAGFGCCAMRRDDGDGLRVQRLERVTQCTRGRPNGEVGVAVRTGAASGIGVAAYHDKRTAVTA